MLANLKNVFSTTPMVLLFDTITPNILKYVRILLKLSPPLQIYRQPLDYPNLTYIISPICKNRFRDVNFFIPCESAIGKLSKRMIFVDKIDNVIQIAKYLQSRLPKRI